MRSAKQLLYGVFYLIFWIALGSGVYYLFIKPAPTCYDKLQNQNEEGIDCGGVCSAECMPALSPLSAGQVYVFPLDAKAASTTQVHASLVAEVRNPNIAYGASDFSFTFNVYDAAGKVIAPFSGFSYIYSGEVKYVVLANVELPQGSAPVSADITFAKPVWKKAAIFAKPDISANISSLTADNTLSIQGTVRNDGSLTISADLAALFFDAQGSLRGVSVTLSPRISPREARLFSIFHPLISGVSLDRTRVVATGYISE